MECYGLAPRTEHSISDRGALLRHFEEIRTSGVAFDREESLLGGVCLAAAVQQGDYVLGAVSVSTPVSRMNAAFEEEVARSVKTAAATISKSLRL